MCGICGIYEYGRRQPVEGRVVEEMLEIMRHRGPDEGGMHLDRELAIGSRRLSIIDLEGGTQPISNEDGSVTVVSNGEIYNYRELRRDLAKRGHVLRTESDTEVIVHLYEEFGDECVARLRGMFGLAIWDARRRRLLVARDRLGIKPLYFSAQGGRLVFASEIKSILQHPRVEARPDLEALSAFLTLKYVPSPQTMFAGIEALPPGFLLTCDAGGARTRPYWDVSFAERRHVDNEEEVAEELRERLRECVAAHLVSDVPFGAFLSGGVDSSTVVALMSQILEHPVKTFAVGFEGPGSEYSELPYARLVANRYATDHHEVLVRPEHLVDLAEKVIWHLDQPIADEAVLANYMVASLAAQHVKMVLTGEGGDELFAGYARYSWERFSPAFAPLPEFARSALLAGAHRLPGLRRPKIALFALLQEDQTRRLANWFPLFNEDLKAELITDQMRARVNGAGATAAFARQLARSDGPDVLSRMLYVDTKLWLPDDLLARGDKTAMAASLEARVPLLDHTLVEFAATLPSNLKIRRLARKYILKKAAAPVLPPEILQRKKQGFPTPISVWFRSAAKPFLRDVLSPTALKQRGLFRPELVERLLDEHERGVADHGQLLWGLLSIELWHRVFVDAGPAREGVAA